MLSWKKDGNGINILKLTALYAIFTAVAVFTAVFFIDSSIFVDTSSSAVAGSTPEPTGAKSTVQIDTNTPINSTITDKNPVVKPILTGIPPDASFLSFSSDGQFCVYCSKGILYVIDIPAGNIVKQISGKDAITYAALMYDRNIVIYYAAGNSSSPAGSGSSSEITVNTYNIDTGVQTIQYALKADSGAAVRQADYSSLTGHVSFDIYNGKSDIIYYINMMKNLIRVPVGGPIENMALTNSRQIIYYEKGNILYYQSHPVTSLKSARTRLLGCDLNDYVYVQSQSDRSLVYVVKGTSVIRKIRLDDPGFISVYSNKINIYLVYPGYLLNLSADQAEKTVYDNEYCFKGLIGNHIYLSDNNGDIIMKNVAEQ